MNIALPAATLLLLLFPGLLLVHSFLGHIGRRPQEPAGQSGITWPWLIALLLAPVFHVTLSWLNSLAGAPPVDYDTVFFLLAGKYDSGDGQDQYAHALASLAKYRAYIAWYFIEAMLGALLVGWFARWCIRTSKLDRTFELFRFGNDWYYLLWGEVGTNREPDGVFVAVTMAAAGKCYLYIGLLENFVVGTNGHLARIHLKAPFRRLLDNDAKVVSDDPMSFGFDDRYYEITGDELVIMARDVQTVNVKYIYLEDDSTVGEEGAPESPAQTPNQSGDND